MLSLSARSDLHSMDDPFMPRDSSSSPDTFPRHRPDLNNLVLPPIRPAPRIIDLGHLETLRDVENAFRTADAALRQAREALRNDRAMAGRFASASTSHTANNRSNSRNGNSSGNTSDFVDLTTISSDTSNEDPEVQWSATRHPDDPQPQPRTRTTTSMRHGPARSTPASAFGLAHLRPYPHYVHPPPIPNQRAEESAIRRQRQARRDWERVERRNRERAAEQAQIDALARERVRLQAEQVLRRQGLPVTVRNEIRLRRYSSDSTTSSISILSNDSIDSEDTNPTTQQNTQNTSHPSDSITNSMPPTQSIDLTSLEDQPSTQDKILSLQQQSAIAAQNALASTSKDSSSSSKEHATPLSTYRCAICMDTPTSATTTICGHVFCHTCLKDSLKWSAQQRRDDAGLHGRRAPNAGTGLCPVCRKVLHDKEGGPKPSIVGLEIRTISRKDWERKKKQEKIDEERDSFLRNLSEKNTTTSSSDLDKGKEKEKDPTGDYEYVKKEEQGESPGYEALRQVRGRPTRKRRRDETEEYETL